MLGRNAYLVHMGWIEEDDIAVLKEHDVSICHCASASMFGGFGCIAHGKFPNWSMPACASCSAPTPALSAAFSTWCLQDREFQTIDEADYRKEAAIASTAILDRIDTPLRSAWPIV